jgi:hypothetical protein
MEEIKDESMHLKIFKARSDKRKRAEKEKKKRRKLKNTSKKLIKK